MWSLQQRKESPPASHIGFKCLAERDTLLSLTLVIKRSYVSISYKGRREFQSPHALEGEVGLADAQPSRHPTSGHPTAPDASSLPPFLATWPSIDSQLLNATFSNTLQYARQIYFSFIYSNPFSIYSFANISQIFSCPPLS